MKELVSSSIDEFSEVINEASLLDVEAEQAGDNSEADCFLDSRRRLEDLLAERKLLKDIQEFDFDL
ncbi:MAG: hypothetical protein KTR20_03715 [Cellvibrionaceae bacterium]|nr:hypothetical protein [Cellvibrionaceae bacterium]